MHHQISAPVDRALDQLCAAIDGDLEAAQDLEAACQRSTVIRRAVLEDLDTRLAVLRALRDLIGAPRDGR